MGCGPDSLIYFVVRERCWKAPTSCSPAVWLLMSHVKFTEPPLLYCKEGLLIATPLCCLESKTNCCSWKVFIRFKTQMYLQSLKSRKGQRSVPWLATCYSGPCINWSFTSYLSFLVCCTRTIESTLIVVVRIKWSNVGKSLSLGPGSGKRLSKYEPLLCIITENKIEASELNFQGIR